LCPSGSRRSCGCSMAGAKVQKPVGGRVGAAYPRNAPFRIGSRPMTLIARDLTVEIGSKTIVRGVSFDVRPGDKVGLVGRNGAGKTTLFKVLGGELAPVAGAVKRTGATGYLSQDPRADAAPDDT